MMPQSEQGMSGMYSVSRQMEDRIELDAVMAAADDDVDGQARRQMSATTDKRSDGG
jgi:hypothetical protein